jgi:predicted negative regulator of RcsB-dependent stress response
VLTPVVVAVVLVTPQQAALAVAVVLAWAVLQAHQMAQAQPQTRVLEQVVATFLAAVAQLATAVLVL